MFLICSQICLGFCGVTAPFKSRLDPDRPVKKGFLNLLGLLTVCVYCWSTAIHQFAITFRSCCSINCICIRSCLAIYLFCFWIYIRHRLWMYTIHCQLVDLLFLISVWIRLKSHCFLNCHECFISCWGFAVSVFVFALSLQTIVFMFVFHLLLLVWMLIQVYLKAQLDTYIFVITQNSC